MDSKRVSRKLRAILSADVQGHSRLMTYDEVVTIKTITEYSKTISSLVEQWKGRVVDSTCFGFSMVKGIVEAHGSRCWAESEGQGWVQLFFRLSPRMKIKL